MAIGPAAADAELLARIDERISKIRALMIEKENLQLEYVFNKVPKPYYERWKFEANDIYALTVAIRRRRNRITKAG